MELNNEVYTSKTTGFGEGSSLGFAFPQIDFALKGIEGDEPSDLTAEGLAYPEGITITYLGAPSGGSLNLCGEEEEASSLEISEDGAAVDLSTAQEVGESCPVLYHPDWDLIEDLKAQGGSISIERALRRYDAESLMRVVGAGYAIGEVFNEERMFSLTERKDREVRNASSEVAAARAEEAAEDLSREARRLAHAILAKLSRMGACSESGLYSSLTPLFARSAITAVVTELGGAGEIRRVRSRSGLTLLGGGTDSGAGPAHGSAIGADFHTAARRLETAERQSRRNARIRGKVFAEGAWISPERESGPDPDSRFASDLLGAERTGEAVISTASGKTLSPSRTPRQREAAKRRVNRAIQKGRDRERMRREAITAACKEAARQALKVHLRELAPTGRLELFLQTSGQQDFAILAKHSTDAVELKAAARELFDTGRIGVSRKDGAVSISAANRYDRESLGRTLIRIIAKEGIAVPKGTRLARRVSAARAAITRQANAKADVAA